MGLVIHLRTNHMEDLVAVADKIQEILTVDTKMSREEAISFRQTNANRTLQLDLVAHQPCRNEVDVILLQQCLV